MNCLDCAGMGRDVTAVAVCHGCGAGVCAVHARVVARWLTRTAVINRTVMVEPPARLVWCPVCDAAQQAASGRPASKGRDRAGAR